MMKYFKNQENTVFAFEEDGSQDEFISADLIQMTAEEVDYHLYPENYLTDEEIQQAYLGSLRPLPRRQFMLSLIEYDLDDDIEAAISAIEDTKVRKTIRVEYKDAQIFERFSESVLLIASLLNLDDKKLNEMWEYAQKL